MRFFNVISPIGIGELGNATGNALSARFRQATFSMKPGRTVRKRPVTPREASRVFAQTKPKLAAFTHIVLVGSERIPPPTIDDVLTETRQTYTGPLAVGEDLMAFEVGETVTVRRHQPPLSGSNPAKVA